MNMFEKVRTILSSGLLSYMLNLVLIIEVVLLWQKNSKLNTEFSQMKNSYQGPVLAAGEKVSPLKLETLSGTFTSFDYVDSSKNYLLFVFSTSCPHCQKTMGKWKSIVSSNPSDCTTIGISLSSLEDTKRYVDSTGVNFQIFANADTTFGPDYKIGGVPETILLDGHSRVKKTWLGELTPDQTKEIVGLLGSP
jgi:peroxiredoxin